MFKLEALRAKHGDALLLHYGTEAKPKLAVIDAGPGGVYKDAVSPRLNEIREERGLADDEPLEIDLMMVSHLDADHITGILELIRKLRDLKQGKKPVPWEIKRFWHNAFQDLTEDEELETAAVSGGLSTASVGDFLQIEGSSLLASVGQGRELRDLVKFLGLDGNPPFKGIVKYPHSKNPVKLQGLELTVVGPDEKNLKILQDDWNKKVKELLKKAQSKSAKAELAAYVDRSVYNLSSIVVYAKAEGKTILLTGDARGDYTLEALRGAGLLKKGKTMKVDLLKLPHHGSDRNVDQDYFDSIQAKHYVISADGRFTNPDVPTLEMISKSRKDDDFTIWLTNAPSDFADDAVGDEVAKFFAKEKKKGRKYDVVYRDSDELGVTIEL
jgi:ribonuclease BN (tRNA processing enzyme)